MENIFETSGFLILYTLCIRRILHSSFQRLYLNLDGIIQYFNYKITQYTVYCVLSTNKNLDVLK